MSFMYFLLPILRMLIWYGLLSRQTVGTVCVCYLFQFVLFFASYFLCNDWTCAAFVSLSDLPSTAIEISSSLIMSVYTSHITDHALLCFPIFSWTTDLNLLLCVLCFPFSCYCFHLIGLIQKKKICCFTCLIHVWSIAFMDFNSI